MRYSAFLIGLMLVIAPAYAAQQSLLASLSDAEKSYYIKVFDYTMETVKAGEPYGWESYNGKGSIVAGEPFASKSKALCRKFTESYAIGGKNGGGGGVACRRDGDNGWCRLRETDALTCAMESPNYFTNQGVESVVLSF